MIFAFLVVLLLYGATTQAQQPSCTDSDNSIVNNLGADRRVLGTTNGLNRSTGRAQRSVDECWHRQLSEWYCDGNYAARRTQNCPQGESCVRGVCTVPSGNGARNAACNDGAECQSGFCDLATRRCTYQPLGGACNETSQCGNAASVLCNNYRCQLSMGSRCERGNECASGYCSGRYCSGGQGAPEVCFNVCSLAPIGERCENGEACISGRCSEVPNDPSYGGNANGGEGPDCHSLFAQDEIVDETPPCHPSICGEPQPNEAQAPAAPVAPPPPACIKVCRSSEGSIAHGERCSSHGNVGRDLGDECSAEGEVCRPWLNQRTRVFYSIRNKYCTGKIRSNDGCWYNAHCQSNVCRDGRCQ